MTKNNWVIIKQESVQGVVEWTVSDGHESFLLQPTLKVLAMQGGERTFFKEQLIVKEQ